MDKLNHDELSLILEWGDDGVSKLGQCSKTMRRRVVKYCELENARCVKLAAKWNTIIVQSEGDASVKYKCLAKDQNKWENPPCRICKSLILNRHFEHSGISAFDSLMRRLCPPPIKDRYIPKSGLCPGYVQPSGNINVSYGASDYPNIKFLKVVGMICHNCFPRLPKSPEYYIQKLTK